MSLLPTSDRPFRTDRFASNWDTPAMTVTREKQPTALPGCGDEVIVITGTVSDMIADVCANRQHGVTHIPDSRANDPDWSGVPNVETALALAVDGWHEGVHAVEGMFARMTLHHTSSILPTLAYSDEPDGDIDVAAWMQGEDECYMVETPSNVITPNAGRLVDIVYDLHASCAESATTLLKRGMAVATLVYMLDRAGYQTRVRFVSPTLDYHNNQRYRMEVTVKEAHHVMDLPRLVFWLGHPAAMRQLYIFLYRRYRQDGIAPNDNDSNMPKRGAGVIVLDSPINGDAEAWITERLRENGIVIY